MDATTVPTYARVTEEQRNLEPMRGALTQGEDKINNLSDDVLSAILERASSSKGMYHALVCRRWLRLAQQLQKVVHVSAKSILDAGELLRSLARLPNVTSLSLDNESIDFLNDEFLKALPSACPQLSRLRLDAPRYFGVPYHRISLQCLRRFLLRDPRLEELTLNSCLRNMRKLPSLASLSSLRVLKIRESFRDLPDEFGALRALEELHLICRELRSLPASVTQLTRLSRLCLTNCFAMEQLPSNLGALSGLMSLEISASYRLKTIPESIGALKELRRLVLRYIKCQLPDVGHEWRKLEELRLEYCDCVRLPPISLESLALLSIRHCCSLRALFEDIGEASALRELEIVESPIECLTDRERWMLAPYGLVLPPTLLALPRLAHVVPENVSCLPSLTAGGAEADGRRQPIARPSPLQSFSLWGCDNLTHLPHTLDALAPSLRALTLADLPEFYSLPAEVCRLIALTSLSLLRLPHVESLPSALSALSALRALKITGARKLTVLPESLDQLAALESLELDDYPLASRSDLPEPLFDVTALQSRPTALRSLPASLGRLTALQSLVLRCVALAAMPATVGGLSALTHLSITHCAALTALPDAIGELGRLKSLTIRSASIATLPNTLGGLTCLEELLVCDCPLLAALPASLCALSRLRTLSLTKCPALSALPDAIGQLRALRRFSLEDCSALARLPASLPRLPALESLDIERCPLLAHLPDDFGPLPRLTRLSVRNEFPRPLASPYFLPPSLSRLPVSLTPLPTSFSRLPASLSRLPALRILDLSSCASLSALPPDLAALPALHSLVLDGCSALAELPAGLARARGLRHLDVRRCPAVRKDTELGLCERRVNVTWSEGNIWAIYSLQQATRRGKGGEGRKAAGGEAVTRVEKGAERGGGGLDGAATVESGMVAQSENKDGGRMEEVEGEEGGSEVREGGEQQGEDGGGGGQAGFGEDGCAGWRGLFGQEGSTGEFARW
ncbi:unnamed protein product [Closterium sp. Naga37s-1]|nr:unnamed protein product [Closterium sp. Naga37s-1]